MSNCMGKFCKPLTMDLSNMKLVPMYVSGATCCWLISANFMTLILFMLVNL